MDAPVLKIIFLLGILEITSGANSSLCSTTPPRGVSFTISSKKNHSGHWNALVHLMHGNNLAPNGDQETGLWNVDVKQTLEKCGQWEAVDVLVTVAAPPPLAGPGYELVPGIGYYKLHRTPQTWPDARQICYEEGGHLAILNSESELKALQGIFSLYPNIMEGWQNKHAHIGFHDLYVEGEFVTIFGESLESAGYSKFTAGYPNKGINGNCGCMERTTQLYDVGCQVKLAFFCEQELI